MRRLALKYWWLFPLLLCVCMIGMILLLNQVPTIIESIAFIVLLLVVIIFPVSWAMLLVNKRWWQCLISFALSIIIFAMLRVPMALAAMDGPDDFGGKNMIPEGLEFQIPLIDGIDNDVLIDSLNTDTYLQIWNGIQGGMYMYDFHYPSLPAGKIFLRCYEVTEDTPLSEHRLAEESAVSVDSTNHFSLLVNQKEFTIYEGDWGDYYAARIEVWFRDAVSKKERKLCEKVYRVEGWMR